MADSFFSPEGSRTRRMTAAVLSNIPGFERWWAPQVIHTDAPPPRYLSDERKWYERAFYHAQRFFGGPIPSRAAVVAAIIMPCIALGRMPKVRTLIRESAPVCLFLGEPAKQLSKEEIISLLWKNVALEPENTSHLRQLSHLLIDTDPAAARRCFHELETKHAITTTDRAAHALLLNAMHDFTGARAVLSRAVADETSKILLQEAWLTISADSGDMATALDLMSQMNASQSLNLKLALRVADSLFHKPAPAASHLSLEKHLLKCLQQSDAKALYAEADKIIGLPWVNADLRPEVATLLTSLPQPSIKHMLAAVRLRFPTQLDTILHNELILNWSEQISQSGGLSATEKVEAAEYFRDQMEHELVTQLISEQESLTEPTLYQMRLNALLETGEWRKVGRLSMEHGYSSLVYGNMLRSALVELHSPYAEKASVEHLLKAAMQEGRVMRQTAGCFTIGVAALDLHQPAIACQAFAYSIEFSNDRRRTLNAVMHHARKHGMSVSELLESVKRTCIFHDDDKDEALAYLTLLAQKDTQQTALYIQQKRQSDPNDVYLRFLDSFAHYQQGHYSAAADMLVPLPKYRWQQGEAAVIAAIMASAGQMERSNALLYQVNEQQIFAEERALVEPWKFRLKLGKELAKTEGE